LAAFGTGNMGDIKAREEFLHYALRARVLSPLWSSATILASSLSDVAIILSVEKMNRDMGLKVLKILIGCKN
jgi:hypothetical protein